MIDAVTPMILTFNEEDNIGRTLAALGWARQILVMDSGSTDATLAILAADPRVRVVHRKFDSFAGQCNAGLAEIGTEWVLSLDADYELSEALGREVAALAPEAGVAGYRARFVYRIHGRPLRATLYPPRTVLYRVAGARYRDEGHGHVIEVPGPVRDLAAPIYHDDRKPLARWFRSQAGYAEREADHLLGARRADLKRTDRLRLRVWIAPLVMPFYTLFARGLILDGWAGFHYALQRTAAEAMIALAILDRRLRR